MSDLIKTIDQLDPPVILLLFILVGGCLLGGFLVVMQLIGANAPPKEDTRGPLQIELDRLERLLDNEQISSEQFVELQKQIVREFLLANTQVAVVGDSKKQNPFPQSTPTDFID